MPETYQLDLITRLQDNGDGGYTLRAYNSKEELIQDHPKFEKYNPKTKKFEHVEPTEEEKDEILNGDDEYENGYIGRMTVSVVVENGVAKLGKPLCVGVGQ